MRNLILTLSLAIAVSLLFVNSTRGRASQAGGADEVKTLVNKWMEAKAAGDAKLIAGYLDDAFVGVGPLGQANDKRAFVELLADKNLKIGHINSTDQSLRLHGVVVVVTGVHHIDGTRDGKNVSGDYRYVEVIRKVDDRWRILSSTLTKIVDGAK